MADYKRRLSLTHNTIVRHNVEELAFDQSHASSVNQLKFNYSINNDQGSTPFQITVLSNESLGIIFVYAFFAFNVFNCRWWWGGTWRGSINNDPSTSKNRVHPIDIFEISCWTSIGSSRISIDFGDSKNSVSIKKIFPFVLLCWQKFLFIFLLSFFQESWVCVGSVELNACGFEITFWYSW